MQPALATAGFSRAEDFLAMPDSPHAGSTTVRRITISNGPTPQSFHLKVYRRHDNVALLLRRDKASIEVLNYEHLRRCGVNVPDVICHGYRNGLFGPRESFIITREVSGAVPLDEYVDANWPTRPIRFDRRRRQLLLATARLVQTMHAGNFFHIDLQWRNILVAEREGGWRLCVIDSSRGRFSPYGLFREHGRLRDLSSFAKQAIERTSQTEQLRWLCACFNVRRLTPQIRCLFDAISRDRHSKDNSHRR